MITDKLKQTIANHVEASLNIVGYGCNVDGRDSVMFSKIFTEISENTMNCAKYLFSLVRTVSEATDYSNNSVDVLGLNKTLVCEPIVGNKGAEMCIEIIRINECLIDDYTVILEQAQEENKITLSQYCVLRIDELSVFNRRLQIIIK